MFDFPEKILLVFALPKIFKQGTSGIEPPSSESAVERSTTDLRSLKTTPLIFQNVFFKQCSLLFL